MTFISFNFRSAGPRIIFLLAVLFSFSTVDFPQKPAADANVIVKECWNFPVPGSGIASLTGDDENIFTATFSGDVSAFDAKSGEKTWTSELGGVVVSDILIDADRVYIATNSGDESEPSTIRTLSRDTGITVWSSSVPRSERVFLLADRGGVVAISDSKISRFEPAKGDLLWAKDLSAKLSAPPIILDGTIFQAAEDRSIAIVDAGSGAAKGSREVGQKVVFIGGTEGDGILFSNDRGGLTKWTSDHAVSWLFKAGARITKAIRTKEGILAASDDNFIYMIWDYNGDVTWKIRLSGRVSDVVVLNESLAAATAIGSNAIFILDLAKGRAVTRIGGTDGDDPVGRMLSNAEGKLIVATDADVRLYSLNGCGK